MTARIVTVLAFSPLEDRRVRSSSSSRQLRIDAMRSLFGVGAYSASACREATIPISEGFAS